MRLYHFTAREYLPSIARHGLWQGCVPSRPGFSGMNAVNLTSSDQPHGHGLENAGGNKAAVRFCVDIDADDPLLERWARYASRRVKPKFRALLEEGRRPETWFLYWGIIAPERLTLFDIAAGATANLADHVNTPSPYESAPPTTDLALLKKYQFGKPLDPAAQARVRERMVIGGGVGSDAGRMII